MNRAQRRRMQRFGIIRFININSTPDLMKCPKPQSVFDKNRIVNDEKLYQEYNLPHDSAMTISIWYFFEEFEENLINQGLEGISDIVKLRMFKGEFNSYVESGFLLKDFEATRKRIDDALNEAMIHYNAAE